MKRLNFKDYNGDGILINLDVEYIPYQKLIYEPDKYLKKNKKYYFHCKHGIKSKEVVTSLSMQGYDVTQLI